MMRAFEMELSSKIFVAGHRGMVGSAIWRELQTRGFRHLIGKTRSELDLLNQAAVQRFFESERPEFVFLAAAKVGGIQANQLEPAAFLYENLQIQSNVIHAAWKSGVKKLLNLGSSCIYPKLAPQPMKEDYLLSGPLEPTNEWYAVAKIAGLKLVQAYRRQHKADFISAMPTNLYGINDNFDLTTSHVVPAMIRKFHEAKIANRREVTLWGTGTPRRELMYADDLARACIFLMENYTDESFINVGVGEDVTIAELAEIVGEVVGYTGAIVWDKSKPDGTPRKLMDVSRLTALGWKPQIDLPTGLKLTYEAFLKNAK
jgi:GDP-L-fucose synthase